MYQSLTPALAAAHIADLRRDAATWSRPHPRPGRIRERAGWWLVRRGLRLIEPAYHL